MQFRLHASASPSLTELRSRPETPAPLVKLRSPCLLLCGPVGSGTELRRWRNEPDNHGMLGPTPDVDVRPAARDADMGTGRIRWSSILRRGRVRAWVVRSPWAGVDVRRGRALGAVVAVGLVLVPVRAGAAPLLSRPRGRALFKAGAARVTVTPPQHGAIVNDPADCRANGSDAARFNGPL